FVARSTKNAELSRQRADRGTLIASGLIAGGALFGVFATITKMCGVQSTVDQRALAPQLLGIAIYLALFVFVLVASCRKKQND
ncbi:MAG: peptide transporter, partial [Muribaculaceae bacterium]|nr:peptide transporter [Muribaculaceae bacterium]